MQLRTNLPGSRRLGFLRNAAIRTGVYTGICLSLVFTSWLVIANQVPFLERFAFERNVAAAGVFVFLAAISSLAGESPGFEHDGLDDLQRRLPHSWPDLPRAQRLAQYLSGFHGRGGQLLDVHNAVLDRRDHPEGARRGDVSLQAPRELKTHENLPLPPA